MRQIRDCHVLITTPDKVALDLNSVLKRDFMRLVVPGFLNKHVRAELDRLPLHSLIRASIASAALERSMNANVRYFVQPTPAHVGALRRTKFWLKIQRNSI